MIEKARNSGTCQLIRNYKPLSLFRLHRIRVPSVLQGAAYGKTSCSIVEKNFTGSADAVSLSGVLVDSFCYEIVLQSFRLEEFVVLQPLTHTKKKKCCMCEREIEGDDKQAVYHHIHCTCVTCKFTFCTYTKHCKHKITDCLLFPLRSC